MVGIHWADAMGSGLPGWSGAVGSCLAIQASILIMGSLLGLSQRFEARGRLAGTGQLPEPQGSLNLIRKVQPTAASRLGALSQEGSRTLPTQPTPSLTRP